MQRLQLPDNTERMMCHFHKLHSPHLMGPVFMQQSLQILTAGALTLCLPAKHWDPTHLSLRISRRHRPHPFTKNNVRQSHVETNEY